MATPMIAEEFINQYIDYDAFEKKANEHDGKVTDRSALSYDRLLDGCSIMEEGNAERKKAGLDELLVSPTSVAYELRGPTSTTPPITRAAIPTGRPTPTPPAASPGATTRVAAGAPPSPGCSRRRPGTRPTPSPRRRVWMTRPPRSSPTPPTTASARTSSPRASRPTPPTARPATT